MIIADCIKTRKQFKKLMSKVEKYRRRTMNTQMMSLYDYLGRAAGPDLGQQVAQSAAKSKPRPKMETRYVNQGGYKGDVILYPKWFLDEYFGGGTNEGKGGNKQLLFG